MNNLQFKILIFISENEPVSTIDILNYFLSQNIYWKDTLQMIKSLLENNCLSISNPSNLYSSTLCITHEGSRILISHKEQSCQSAQKKKENTYSKRKEKIFAISIAIITYILGLFTEEIKTMIIKFFSHI